MDYNNYDRSQQGRPQQEGDGSFQQGGQQPGQQQQQMMGQMNPGSVGQPGSQGMQPGFGQGGMQQPGGGMAPGQPAFIRAMGYDSNRRMGMMGMGDMGGPSSVRTSLNQHNMRASPINQPSSVPLVTVSSTPQLMSQHESQSVSGMGGGPTSVGPNGPGSTGPGSVGPSSFSLAPQSIGQSHGGPTSVGQQQHGPTSVGQHGPTSVGQHGPTSVGNFGPGSVGQNPRSVGPGSLGGMLAPSSVGYQHVGSGLPPAPLPPDFSEYPGSSQDPIADFKTLVLKDLRHAITAANKQVGEYVRYTFKVERGNVAADDPSGFDFEAYDNSFHRLYAVCDRIESRINSILLAHQYQERLERLCEYQALPDIAAHGYAALTQPFHDALSTDRQRVMSLIERVRKQIRDVRLSHADSQPGDLIIDEDFGSEETPESEATNAEAAQEQADDDATMEAGHDAFSAVLNNRRSVVADARSVSLLPPRSSRERRSTIASDSADFGDGGTRPAKHPRLSTFSGTLNAPTGVAESEEVAARVQTRVQRETYSLDDLSSDSSSMSSDLDIPDSDESIELQKVIDEEIEFNRDLVQKSMAQLRAKLNDEQTAPLPPMKRKTVARMQRVLDAVFGDENDTPLPGKGVAANDCPFYEIPNVRYAFRVEDTSKIDDIVEFVIMAASETHNQDIRHFLKQKIHYLWFRPVGWCSFPRNLFSAILGKIREIEEADMVIDRVLAPFIDRDAEEKAAEEAALAQRVERSRVEEMDQEMEDLEEEDDHGPGGKVASAMYQSYENPDDEEIQAADDEGEGEAEADAAEEEDENSSDNNDDDDSEKSKAPSSDESEEDTGDAARNTGLTDDDESNLFAPGRYGEGEGDDYDDIIGPSPAGPSKSSQRKDRRLIAVSGGEGEESTQSPLGGYPERGPDSEPGDSDFHRLSGHPAGQGEFYATGRRRGDAEESDIEPKEDDFMDDDEDTEYDPPPPPPLPKPQQQQPPSSSS